MKKRGACNAGAKKGTCNAVTDPSKKKSKNARAAKAKK